MNLRGTLADAVVLLKVWSRAKGVLVVSLAMPLLLLLAFGFIFGPEETARPLVLVEDASGANESERFLSLLEAHDGIALARHAPPSGSDTATWLKEQGATTFVRIPPGFGADQNVTLQVVLDPTDPVHASVARAAIEAALARHAGREPLAVQELAAAPLPPYSAFLLAGTIGLSAMLVGLSMGYHSISELRHAGLLQRLAVSPLSKREWLFARMAATSLIGVLSAGILFLLALLAFPLPPHGSVATLLLVMGGTLVFTGLGTLLGIAVKDPQTGAAIMNLVLLPMVLLSGAFFDVARLPVVLQWVAQVSPLTHLNNGLRADLLFGDTHLAFLHVGALLLASVALVAAGSRLIRWTDEG